MRTNAAIRFSGQGPELVSRVPGLYMMMIESAELVADRYAISRDEYARRSLQSTASAQQAGRVDDEIVAMPTDMMVTDKATGVTNHKKSRHQQGRG